MATSRHLISELTEEAIADEVGLWLIITKLREEGGITDVTQLRTATLNFVREFLDSGQVAAGYYRPEGGGIAIWDMPTADVISRIGEEWDCIGREPNIGDIVVFVGRPEA
jgi:hypothetical protein